VIGVALDDVEATLLGHGFQIMQLTLRVLVDGTDPQVKRGAFHARTLMP
jgi:hypothetical protein